MPLCIAELCITSLKCTIQWFLNGVNTIVLFTQTPMEWMTTQLDSILCGAMRLKGYKIKSSPKEDNAVLKSRYMKLLLGSHILFTVNCSP